MECVCGQQMAGRTPRASRLKKIHDWRLFKEKMKVLSPMITMSKGRSPVRERRSAGIKIHISPSTEEVQVANTRTTRKRIFLVDDHPAFRLGLAAVLSTEFDLEICGEASCAEDALMAIAEVQPHLVLTDISMPDVSGLELIRRLGEIAPKIKVIAMSVHKDSVYALPVAQAGGYGYLNKETPGDRIIAAIRCVLNGGMAFQQDDLMEDRPRGLPEREASGTVAGIEFLTVRELEVFELLGQGFRTRQVAEQLEMSIKTAEVHRSNIRRKLDFNSSAELLHAAYRWAHRHSQPEADHF